MLTLPQMRRAKLLSIFVLLFFGLTHAQAETWIVGAEENFAPYNYYAENGTFSGIDVEIMQAAAARIGVTLKFQPAPWARVMVQLEQNEIDFAFQLKPTSDRFEAFHMVGPFRKGSTVFATLAGSEIEFTSLYSLKPYVIGTVRGYVYPGKFADATYLVKEETEGSKLNLLKLLNGRVNLIVADKHSIAFAARSLGRLEEIRFLEPALSLLPRYVAFPKARADKANRFQWAVDEIVRDGTVFSILANYEGS